MGGTTDRARRSEDHHCLVHAVAIRMSLAQSALSLTIDLWNDWDRKEGIQKNQLPAAVEGVREGTWAETAPRTEQVMFPVVPCANKLLMGMPHSVKTIRGTPAFRNHSLLREQILL